jgi:hypothetical protein
MQTYQKGLKKERKYGDKILSVQSSLKEDNMSSTGGQYCCPCSSISCTITTPQVATSLASLLHNVTNW